MIDHQSTDGSTTKLPCNVIQVTHEFVHDDLFMHEMITKFQYRLLEGYKYVLYVDCDEFVYHQDGLDAYIDSMDRPCIMANGYELVHMRNREAPINLSQPILNQRNYWIRSKYYSKPVLSAIPFYWGIGRHGAENGGYFDENFFLLHLKRMDYDIALKKNELTAVSNISPINKKYAWGYQCWLTGQGFDSWFYTDFYPNYLDAHIEPIIDKVKKFMPL